MSIKDMKIGTKLGVGFGIVLVLTALIGFLGWNGMRNVVDRVDKADGVMAIEMDALKVRQQEKNFIIRQDQSYLKEVEETVVDIHNRAETIKAKFKQKVNQDQMDEIIKHIGEYEGAFKTYVDLYNQKNQTMEEMREKARFILEQVEALRFNLKKVLEEALKNANSHFEDKLIMADDTNMLIKWLLEARKNEKEYIISGEQKYLDAVLERTKEALSLARDLKQRLASDKNSQQIDTLITAFEGYLASFKKFSDFTNKQTEAEKLMTTAGREMQKVCEEARNDQEAKMEIEMSSASRFIILGAFLAMILGISLAIFITRGILKQLGADPLEVMAILQKVAQGDLTLKIQTQAKDQTSLLFSVKTMINRLQEIVGEVKSAANNVASGTQELSSTSEEMSQGANEQSSSVEEISSSMEEMVSNIKQNADNAQQTERIAVKSAQDAKESGQAVGETVIAMKEIAGKISIIEEIARQTNLLALNAAIEAARAGQHGKGFAVVASEVRKLAERSQVAAAEISQLSSTSVEVAEKAGQMLSKLVPDIQKTSELVQEISSASNEQNSGATQIGKAIQQLEQVVQQNAGASEEVASTAEEMASQAEQLQSTITFFKIENDGRDNARSLSFQSNLNSHQASEITNHPQMAHFTPKRIKRGSTALQDKPSAKPVLSFHDQENGRHNDEMIDQEFEVV